MAFGGLLADWWVLILLATALLVVGAFAVTGWLARHDVSLPWVRGLTPRVLRRIAVARLAVAVAELLRSGVPVVEALRVMAPATGAGLRRRLLQAADEVERGRDLSRALADEHYFDAEFRRLLEIGETSGELEDMLERLGHRYARAADRLIDRLATLLEPFVILVLAVLIGVVVMAAILPLLRLQEIL